jgi:hypothetical protein
MSNNQTMILIIKGAISEMPEEIQSEYRTALEEINAVLDKRGAGGLMALAQIGLERQE